MPLRHDMRRGALLMLGATACFAVMGVFVKVLSARYSFLELMFFRNGFSMPIVLAAGLRTGALLRTRKLGGHAVRALSGMVGMGCAFFALTLLPLADQTALNYTQPLFIILLAIPWLGERPSPMRWAAVVTGFLGVLVIAAGQGAGSGTGGAGVSDSRLLGYAVAALGGFFGGLSTMLVRQLSATEPSTTIVLWQALLMTAMTGLTLPFVWITPGWVDLGLLVLMGLIGGVGQVLNTEAFASAQVSSLGPYTYTGLLWAGLLGWMVWGETPGVAMLAGSALIVGAGFLVLRGEFRRRPK